MRAHFSTGTRRSTRDSPGSVGTLISLAVAAAGQPTQHNLGTVTATARLSPRTAARPLPTAADTNAVHDNRAADRCAARTA
jgi:hypothetical protein